MSIISCRTDQTVLIEMPDESSNEPEILVNASFNGFITDTNGDPIEGAKVDLDDSTVFTDEKGYFKISNQVKGDGAFFKVSANGYINNFASVLPSQIGLGHLRIGMTQGSYIDVFETSGGYDLSIDEKIEINISPNTNFEKDGTVYTDMILSQAEYYDFNPANTNDHLLGELIGVTLEGREQLIQAYGMMLFAAQDDNGGPLVLNDNIDVSLKIPDSKINDASNETTLWYFDETIGFWVEKGLAIRVDDNYQFSINDLGKWACGSSSDFVTLYGQANEGEGISNVKIRITNQNKISDYKVTTTDDQGYYWTTVPKGTPLIIEVLDECNNVTGLKEVNSLVEDELANIQLYTVNVETFRVSGNLICNNQVVVDGYVLINSSLGERYVAVTDGEGQFEIEILDCGATDYMVTGVNYQTNQIGSTVQYESNDLIEIKDLEACNSGAAYFITYQFEDRALKFTDYTVAGDTELGLDLAFDLDFEHQTPSDIVEYKLSVLWGGSMLPANQIVSIKNTDSATESYSFEIQEIGLIDHGLYLEGNAYGIEFTNETTGLKESGSIHFRIEKL